MNAGRYIENRLAIRPAYIRWVLGILLLAVSTVPTYMISGSNLHQDDIVQTNDYVYLPVTMKDAALPSMPILYDIDNTDGDGSYSINWGTVNLAASYVLEEDEDGNFVSPIVAYNGSDTTQAITGKAIGIYYYRVKAENGLGFSDWSNVKSAIVTQPSGPICETHTFGTVGVAWPITSSGRTEHFVAQNTMLIETVEIMSILKALTPTNVYVAAGVNGVQLANKTHYVYSNVYTPYYINKNVSQSLYAGDDVYYYISKAAGTPEAWIKWGNYVKLCGH